MHYKNQGFEEFEQKNYPEAEKALLKALDLHEIVFRE